MEDKAEQVHGEIGRLYACLEKKHDIVCKVATFFLADLETVERVISQESEKFLCENKGKCYGMGF